MLRQLPDTYSIEGCECHIIATYYPNSTMTCLSAIDVSERELVKTLTVDIKEFRTKVPEGYVLVKDGRTANQLKALGVISDPIQTMFAGLKHIPCAQLIK